MYFVHSCRNSKYIMGTFDLNCENNHCLPNSGVKRKAMLCKTEKNPALSDFFVNLSFDIKLCYWYWWFWSGFTGSKLKMVKRIFKRC